MLDLHHGTQVFYSLYFTMTGLHALHVVIGAAVILWARSKVKKGLVNSGRLVFLELPPPARLDRFLEWFRQPHPPSSTAGRNS